MASLTKQVTGGIPLTIAEVNDFRLLIARALEEDIKTGDLTTESTIPKTDVAEARFMAKANGVVAGLSVADLVFSMVDPALRITWLVNDGDRVSHGQLFGTCTGRTHSLLIAERLSLNLMQRMSGIATATRRMVDAVGTNRARILDTRKTAPGMRLIDKLSVRIGGGMNHRIGLYDMVMIKDNHTDAAGGVRPAVERVRKYLAEQKKSDVPIEVEARSLEEVQAALDCGSGIARILLDNMVVVKPSATPNGTPIIDTSLLQRAVTLLAGRIPSEASGNVTLATIPAIAATGVDFISTGAITHSVMALDISMKIKPVTTSRL